jgi:hypothetical protein
MHSPPCKATVRLPAISRRLGRKTWTAVRWLAALAVASGVSAVLLTAEPAWAQSAEVTGTVVALDQGAAMVMDLSASKGAYVGASVEIWRPFRLKHPVSGRVLTDRFQIGTLRITQVGPTLSMAVPASPLNRPAEAGDVVILRNPVTTAAPTAAPAAKPPAPTSKAGAADTSAPQPALTACVHGPEEALPLGEARVLSEMFDALQGAGLVKRIRVYEDYVRSRPQGRYSRVLYEEAQVLRQLLSPVAPATPRQASQAPVAPEDRIEVREFVRPERALSDEPMSFGLELKGPAAGALLHIRTTGAPAFKTFPMKGEGEGYFTAVVPAALMQPPSVEYFIEGVKRDGTTVQLAGGASEPVTLEVDASPSPRGPNKHAYAVSIWTDYASYNKWKAHNDWASQTEGFFAMRFGDTGVRALRSGFGVYRGAGGSISDLDERDLSPRAIGLTYGYLESEIGVSHFFSLLGRGVVGLRDSGVAGGAQLMIRIGNDRKTNMQLGGEVLGGVGLRGIAQLELNTFEHVPILLRTEVTNQPAGTHEGSPSPTESGKTPLETSGARADVGVRGIAQIGYRFTSGLTFSVRGSYQGRNINHSGPGAGAGITYEW